MFIWKALTIVWLISSTYGNFLFDSIESSLSPCARFKYYYANLTSIATSCFIKSSQPLRICQNCKNDYQILKNEYDSLVNEKIGIKEGYDCAENLLRSDLSSAIFDLTAALSSEWSNLNCDQCYKDNNITRDFAEFLVKDAELMLCLQPFTNASLNFSSQTFETLWPASDQFNSTACSSCLPLYNDLNSMYKRIYLAVNRPKLLWFGVCGDMGDIMNTTRYLWSKKFFCDGSEAELGLIAPICVVLVAILMFYCMASTYFHNRMKTVFYKQRRLRAFFDENDSHSGQAAVLKSIN